jgi:hypothetical protein
LSVRGGVATEQDFEFVRQGTMEKEQNEATSTEPRVGATTDLPHDRITVQRFRESFPRARWSDTLNARFVPGRTAERRIGRWRAEMEAEADAFADEKGRDAFAFDPIESRYLEATPSAFQIRTPYSRTVVNEIREIPFARTWVAGCGLFLTRPELAGSFLTRNRNSLQALVMADQYKNNPTDEWAGSQSKQCNACIAIARHPVVGAEETVSQCARPS